VIKLSKAEGVPSSQFGLHDAFPMPGDLRPNPDWAKLPLLGLQKSIAEMICTADETRIACK